MSGGENRGFMGKKDHFKVKKLFSSLLLSYLAVLMVPFVVVFFLISSWNTSTENYYKEVLNNNLTEGRKEFEKRLEVMHAGAFSLVADSSLSWVSSLDDLIPGETSILSLIHCNEKFNEVFADTSAFNDYSVICRNGLSFRKKGMYRGSHFFFDNYRNYSQMTYEEWFDQSLNGKKWTLFPMQEILVDGYRVTAMTYSYPVRSYLRPGSEAKAVIQFLVPMEDIEEMFVSLRSMKASVFVYDSDQTLIAGIAPAGSENEIAELPEILEMTGASGCVTQTLGNEEYMVFYQKSEDGILFAAVLPGSIALESPKRTQTAAWMILFAVVLFEIFLGWRFAWRYSGPVRNVVANLQRMFLGEFGEIREACADQSMDEHGSRKSSGLAEYEFLEQGINRLLESNHSMENVLKEKGVREKVNFMTLLLNGEFHSEQEIADEAAYVGIDLLEDSWFIAVLRIDGELEPILEQIGNQEAVRASYAPDASSLALLIAGNEGQMRWLPGLEACTGVLAIGVGNICTDKSDLYFSYRQACYCADRAEIERKKLVVYDPSLMDLSLPWYPPELQNRLIQAVKEGRGEDVRELFGRIAEENTQKSHLSQLASRMLTANLTMTLLTLHSNLAQETSITETVERNESEGSLGRALSMLEQQFAFLCERTESSRNEKEKEYHDRLIQCLEENYADPQFGVPAAAEAFGLSENYFSIFFKDMVGSSFSGCLETIRLQKAKELIVQGTMNMEQIAQAVGYNSSATFRRAFKRAYQVSPSAWKPDEKETQALKDAEAGQK